MKNVLSPVFYLIQVSILICVLFVFSSSAAKADHVKPVLFPADVEVCSTPIIMIQFKCRYPNIGLNSGFIQSFIAFKRAEMEAANGGQPIEEDKAQEIMEDSHALGLNGLFQHANLDQLHLSVR